MRRKEVLDYFESVGRKLLGVLVVWLLASLLISFIRGMPHSMRDDNACAKPWGIQKFVMGNLFCNDEVLYAPEKGK